MCNESSTIPGRYVIPVRKPQCREERERYSTVYLLYTFVGFQLQRCFDTSSPSLKGKKRAEREKMTDETLIIIKGIQRYGIKTNK
jgi:hypothetical protein